MVRPDKKIRISRALAGKLIPLSISICMVISLAAPGAYGYLEYSRLKKESDFYAAQLADGIRLLAASSPLLWKYQATKYAELIEGFAPNKGIQSVVVLDDRSEPISQLGHMETEKEGLGSFVITGDPAPILFNNQKIGEVVVRLEGEYFISVLLVVFSGCILGGLFLSSMVYALPIGVVKKLEHELLAYQESLEEQVVSRTAELQETAERAVELAEARRQDQQALLEAKATLEKRVLERTRELAEEIIEKEEALAGLKEAQGSLMEMSRTAGMAEVATGVLHNVGNVLNSVNVSCTLIMDQLRDSRIGNVGKVAEMIAAPGDDLAAFLTEDPRGKQIPGYLASLAAALGEEHRQRIREAESLHERIDHIKEIVSMQQTYGRVSGVLETIAPEQLMEDALKLNEGSLVRHDIQVRREYEPVPPVTVDKHKILQIFLNLINNAKYACVEGGGSERIITLGIRGSENGRLRMQVSDNGIGILPENLTRIFQHGFTTRKSGHGFGLHSGALAAKEFSGSLTAHSEGPGLGSTFTLEFPINPGDKA